MHTHTPESFPPRPMGAGETLVRVFRSAAEQSAAEGDPAHPAGRSPSPPSAPLRARATTVPPLQRRLFEAEGRPVRLGRYDVVRGVGSGGMGVVYEAVHVEQGHRVALKTLRWMTASGLGRFKNEFRSLCGVAHPNLVSLYELGADDEEWFFTMELVEGQGFVEHVQGERPRDGWEYLGETFTDDMPSHDGTDVGEIRSSGQKPCFHEGRLRAALRQLASAVDALHGLGKLHRDLNPGNVLVTREGRVVVIDFGLICEREPRAGAPYDGACGTPAYMSPEQGAGRPATTASDWYGFGVMLFEALTGQLPFSGSAVRVLSNKRHQTAPAPSVLSPGVPADLEALCVALLDRDPGRRPSGADVLRFLGAPRASARAASAYGTLFAREGGAPFVGRRAELDALHEARRAVAHGHPVAAVVRGPPGMGKTRLVDRFAAEVAEREDAVVLRGACSPRETIPHRALDALVDALAAQLATLPEAEARAALPPGAHELAVVFPVLDSVGVIADLPPRSGPPPTRAEAEGSTIPSLRELLGTLARARPVVLVLDDAHLVEGEDAERLAQLFGPGTGTEIAAPGALVVLTHAVCAPERSPVIEALERAGVALRRVALGPLAPGEAEELARRALPGNHPAEAATIAAAAEGSPLALEDLVLRFVETGEVSLDEVIAARLGRLPEPALLMAEILAAAGRPVAEGLLFAAFCDVAGVSPGPSADAAPGGDALLALLASTRFACVAGVHAEDPVQIRDDRTRSVVAARTPPAVARRIHMALGRVLGARPDADPAVTADHFERAGAPALARAHLSAAAEKASLARDFDRAAALLSRALVSTPPDTAEGRALFEARAEALAAAGRSAEAAEAYLASAAGARPFESLDRRRRAAEHLLVAGHVDQGLAVLLPVLDAHGVRWPDSPRRTLLTLAARMVELRFRGVRLPDAGRPSPPSTRASARVAALWSAGKGLSTVDPVRSSLFLIEALLAALAAGDAGHAGRALSFVGSILVWQGGASDEARGNDLIDEAARFARRSGDTYLLGFSWFCSAIGRLSAGRFREALARADEGMALMEEAGEAFGWERNAHRLICLQVLFELGALRERARRAEAWLVEARARGDRMGEVQGTLAASFALLAGGDAPGARAAVLGAIGLSWHGGFGLPHQVALWVEVMSLLYEGDAAAARAHLLAAWPSLEAAQLLRIQLVRIEARLLRGLTAVALGRRDLLRLAEADAAALAREKRPHAVAAAALLRAGVARTRGQIARAVDGLGDAARTYASAEMLVHAATARRARGSLLGGIEGRALVEEADATLAAEGVRDGARWAWMYTAVGR